MRPTLSLAPALRVAIQVRLVVTVQEIFDPPVPWQSRSWPHTGWPPLASYWPPTGLLLASY